MNAVLFRDLLMNMLLGLTALVVLVMFNINPKAEEEDSAKSPGNMVISAAWTAGPHDVDLWVKTPGDGKAVGYSNRSGHVANLLRDDLGETGDQLPLNFETVYTRGLPSGQFVINLHGYSIREAAIQVSVEVRIGAPDTSPKLVFEETLDLVQGQERTVISFRLDDKGNVVPGSVNRVFQPLRSAGK